MSTPAIRRSDEMVYYNENDKKKAAWLRELIRAGAIAPGEVDTRSIHDVRADDLRGFVQCHFFSGIGVWSYALRCAGWPDDRPVWTGSCPCQPFSAAGKRKGVADERHLWPEWFRLIKICRPPVIFAEQVASKDGLAWLDLVYADLAGQGYAVGALDLCAAGFGAPHARQRLYIVADATQERIYGGGHERQERRRESTDNCKLGDTKSEVREVSVRQRGPRQTVPEPRGASGTSTSPVGDACGEGLQGYIRPVYMELQRKAGEDGSVGEAGPCNGFWADAVWLHCRDGTFRPTQPCIFPLVDGTAGNLVRDGDPISPNDSPEARVLRIRGYGDAIVAPLAAEFVKAYMESKNHPYINR